MDKELERFENRMKNCESMTDLLLVMSSWQSFSRNNGLTEEQIRRVDEAYLEAEARLIGNVKKSLW